MKSEGTQIVVDTKPTKRVVVDSLTKDATVEACIFDLIDNAIDAASDTIRSKAVSGILSGQTPDSFSDFSITIEMNDQHFLIRDNCGGIPGSHLKKSVLRFGERSKHDTGIGLFGVGLNRALFKIGSKSTLRTDTGSERTELLLDNAAYLKSQDWELPAMSFPSSGEIGTYIEISGLPKDIAKKFATDDEVSQLIDTIGKRYSRFLDKELTIKVNGIDVDSRAIRIRENSPFKPIYKNFNSDDVSIFIELGQHELYRFTIEPDYDQRVNRTLTDDYGWTILCNDRAIVLSDRTPKTGWVKNFHNEFYGMVGTVNFVCSDPANLPWNTLKTDVNPNNQAYIDALEQMQPFTARWREFANEVKKIRRAGGTLTTPPGESQPSPSQTSKGNKKKPSKSSGKTKNKPTPQPPKSVKKPIQKEDHNHFVTILPDDIDEKHCDDKHLSLVHEAKQLSLLDFTYSGLALLRMLFEASAISYYIRKKSYGELRDFGIAQREKAFCRELTKEEKKAFTPSLDDITRYMGNSPESWAAEKANYLKHSLSKTNEYKKTLNSAVHNPLQPINYRQAFQIRDEMLPILRHLIQE